MFYRVEVNPKNIGVVLETPFSLNPTRVGFAYNRVEWQLLSILVDISLKNGISLSSICNAAVEQNPDIKYLLPGIWEVLFEKARLMEDKKPTINGKDKQNFLANYNWIKQRY